MPVVSPEFFDVFKIPILRGRKFTDRDRAGAPGVVIINQTLARQFFPNRDAVGARLILGSKTNAEALNHLQRLEIVGIAGDVRERTDRATDPPGNTIYIPVAQNSDGFTAYLVRQPTIWMVRTRVEPHSLAYAIQTELVQASGGLPAVNIRSMDENHVRIDCAPGFRHGFDADFRRLRTVASRNRNLRY